MKTTIYPGWWQVAMGLLVQAVNAGSVFAAYSIVAAALKSEFAPSNMVLMLGITVSSLAGGLLSPALGTAVDRFSIRTLMLMGSALIASGFFLLSVATDMIQVLAIYAVFMAIATIFLGPIASSALISRWFTHKRGLAMGIAASGGAIGSLLLPPLLQGLIDGLDWRLAFRAYAAIIGLITIPAIVWLVVDRPDEPLSNTATPDDAPDAPAKQTPTAPASTKSAFADPNFWLIALTMGILFCGPIAVVSNLIQIVGAKGIDATQGAFLISIFAGANFAGKMILAAAADRFDHRLILAITVIGVGLGMLGLLYSHGFLLLAASCTVAGMFSGSASPLWSLILSRVYDVARIGKMMGSMTLIIMPFTLLSPPLFGRVYDLTGSYDNALFGYAGLLLVALLCVARLRIAPSDRTGADAGKQPA